jgi:hypothetical protein
MQYRRIYPISASRKASGDMEIDQGPSIDLSTSIRLPKLALMLHFLGVPAHFVSARVVLRTISVIAHLLLVIGYMKTVV